jgi:hypothetical protein
MCCTCCNQANHSDSYPDESIFHDIPPLRYLIVYSLAVSAYIDNLLRRYAQHVLAF